MNEVQWVTFVIRAVQDVLHQRDPHLEISQGSKLPYATEVRSYSNGEPEAIDTISYETDMLIGERLSPNVWAPRLVIEAKLSRITTHSAITYSQKAQTHKQVHPYLRYGILIGDRKHYPLPGRLFRHGAHFDFMLSWKAQEPTTVELNTLIELILEETQASRSLEEIIYRSRSPKRERYTYLHRPLCLKKIE